MNRNHSIFKFLIHRTVPVLTPDPPGSGEMTKTGTERGSDVVYVIAATEEIAFAWLENHYKFNKLLVVGVERFPIAGIIETHTY